MSWPDISRDQVSEYKNHSNIFSLAFPWLFLGGLGDFNNDHGTFKLIANQWEKCMVMYYDGRFAIDKMFSFLHWIL